MARYHTRGILADGRPVIVKVNADDVYEAAALARKELISEGVQLNTIQALKIRPMEAAKSSVYIGAPRNKSSKRGAHLRKQNGAAPAVAATAPAATPASVTTPATPAKPATAKK